MQDEPGGTVLLEEVAAALKAGLPKGFHQRVAANAVGLALRERKMSPAFGRQELERLAGLLGRKGTVDELNRALTVAIKERKLTLGSPELVEHLWQTTCEKMLVDQPNYPAFRDVMNDAGTKETP